MNNPYKDFSKISPQPNTSFRQIENTVFQALAYAGFSGIEMQLILCIIDQTWGFQLTYGPIALNVFEDFTGQDHSYIIRTLKKLEKNRIILVDDPGAGRGKIKNYMFNKYWDTWVTRLSLERVTPSHLLALKGDAQSPLLLERVTPSHPLDEKRVTKMALKGDAQSPFSPDTLIYKNNIEIDNTNVLSGDSKGVVLTESTKYYFLKTGRKRWSNAVQKEKFEAAEAACGLPAMREAIDWALTKGVSDIQSIITTAQKIKARGGNGHEQGRLGEAGSTHEGGGEGSGQGQKSRELPESEFGNKNSIPPEWTVIRSGSPATGQTGG